MIRGAHTIETRSIQDAIVDGLFGGIAGGVAMAAYLMGWAWIAGVNPFSLLAYFDPASSNNPVTGAITHLGVAAVYGLLFGASWWLARRVLRRALPVPLAGVLYGLLLFALALAIVLPANAPLRGIPALHFAIAHALYGLTTSLIARPHAA